MKGAFLHRRFLWGLPCSGPASQVLGLRLLILFTHCAPPAALPSQARGLTDETARRSQDLKDKEGEEDPLGGRAVDATAAWMCENLI